MKIKHKKITLNNFMKMIYLPQEEMKKIFKNLRKDNNIG